MTQTTIKDFSVRVAMMLLVMMLTTATAWATDKTLSGSESYTANDGDVLTGSTSGTVTIPDGAKVTLSDVTISGGIVCSGTATITLVGTNSVSVSAYNKAGIQIGGSGKTLTIKGDGSLNATGGSAAAGIGLGRTWDASVTAGAIVIEGGTVNASGGNGIGTGTVGNEKTASIDGISIKGGTVCASLGKGTINFASTATIGYIKIYDTIDMVDASAITESVTYMHVDGNTETDVTASASTYFTITEDGDRRVIVPKDNTDYTITIADGIEHGTLTGAATAKYMEKVTITATPDFGYRLSRLVVKDAQNKSVATTGNSFFMPKSNVTVSAVFEQGTHGTTEFAWGYEGNHNQGFVTEATIYDGVTTVNLQQGKEYNIGKDYYELEPGIGDYENTFRLDEDPYAEGRDIPYSGGTGTFGTANPTNFRLSNEATAGYYDITMTDAGNGKWNVSILKTAGQMDVVPDQTYTGSEIKPEPLVMAGSLNLTKGTDYVYSYTNNTNAGTAKVRATFQGDYASLGSVEKEFTIVWSETDTDEYTIHNAAEWNVFCDALQDNDTYNRFSGKTVRLDADITVTRMAGSGDNPFCGNFDGQNHKLTLAYGTADAPVDAQFVAPFVCTAADGDHQPTFRNLTIDGTIYATHTQATDHDHVGGLIGHLFGTVTIEQCTSLVEIHAKGGAGGFVGLCEHSVSFTDCHSAAVVRSAGGNNSGFVGWSRSSAWNINFTGCLFDGKLLQQNSTGDSNGGFIGWKGDAKTVTITNCLCAPAPLADGETMASSNSATFSREHSDHPATITNSYYTAAFDIAQGKTTHTVTAGTDVILYSPGPLDNTNTYYNVSGIRAYTTGGLYYNHNLYYGSGDRLSILLGNTRDDEPLGYRYTYAFSGGTADEYEYSADDGETSYHLTMPDADVTVSLDTEHLAPIDWATVNQGNSTDPYMIYNKDQLDLLAHRVNGTHGETANDFNGVYFKLGANITYAPQELTIDNDNDGTNDSNYEAISSGSGGTFNGHFNGDNKTISGIRIYKGGTNKGDKQQGLFGNTGSSASIYNLNLVDADITGYSLTGGIVGNNQGTVSNCHVAASVIIRAVQNEAYYHGGIVGFNLGTITHCTSSATLAVGDDVTERAGYGGIAGDNDETGKLIDNLVIGAVVPTAGYSYGAICGYNRGTIARNYYRACTVANSENATGVGCYKSDVTDDNGAVPVYTLDLSTGITTTSEPVINYDNTNYYAGTITLNGGLPDDAPEHYTYAYTVNGNAISGNTFAINADATVGTGLYPADWATEGNSGTETDPYMIYNKDQLDLLAHRVNGTHGETANDYEGKWFQLGTDITYAPQELTIDNDNDNDKTNDSNYEAIGSGYRSFNGHFDGAGHTVSGIRIYSGGTFAYFCQGLFGTTGSSANIHDVTLADADITGDFYTGGIVGENQGTVSNCHVAASVIVRAVQDGAYQHGGIVGRNRPSGTVSSCTSAATLTIADGVTDCQYYGGIAGVNEGSLTDNLATGAVVPAAAYNTYGAISGVKDGTLQHNYYTACTVANVKNATGVGCGGIYDGGDYTVADITDDDGAVPALRDNADNTKAIALLAALASTTDNHTPVDLGWGEGQFPLQLVGRTLYKDGDWNTLCLPFDVTIANSPLAGDGVDVRTLDNTDFSNGTLTLDFTDKDAVTTLKAGKPYIVRWDKPDNYVAYDGTNAAECSDLVNPVFNGVTVSTATANVETDCVDFIGILSPTVLYEDGAEKTNLYMGAANKLYYPTVEGFKLNACRGYFKLKGVVVNGNGNDNGNENAIRSFDINFGDDATGIVEMRDEKGEMRNGYGYEDGGWYTVDGRRLDGKPAQKGLYIHGGRKVVIK